MRSDRLIQCFPTINREWHAVIEYLAAVKGISKTRCAGQIAHYAVWNHAVLDQLQPYFRFTVALDWDTHASDNSFHAWMPDQQDKDIRPIIQAERREGRRFKFRISQEDRKRQQVIAWTLSVTKIDAIWLVLIPLVLLDGHSLYNLTHERLIEVIGYHPLKQTQVTARSWNNERSDAI